MPIEMYSHNEYHDLREQLHYHRARRKYYETQLKELKKYLRARAKDAEFIEVDAELLKRIGAR